MHTDPTWNPPASHWRRAPTFPDGTPVTLSPDVGRADPIKGAMVMLAVVVVALGLWGLM